MAFDMNIFSFFKETHNRFSEEVANSNLIFDLPAEERLAAAMNLLGLNFGNLSDVAGHA